MQLREGMGSYHHLHTHSAYSSIAVKRNAQAKSHWKSTQQAPKLLKHPDTRDPPCACFHAHFHLLFEV